ncbi:hypothetical protein GCM10023194_53300 [Planotetraspora phitsanulokensis]|uniref:Uncharacterized protein n=1 Tax=Planotetraspora phitsanulokensis TaxID=575192 RepID=A0A8J3UCF6_9ACTN|nr:hypothetical protein [Planotetraspora phitsanulokensis]GII42668.1 hypothetical protein Pph01_76710 [Planotetraspora phitsanulokensis]
MEILLTDSTGEIDLSADRATLSHLADLLARGSGSVSADPAQDAPFGQTPLTHLFVQSVDGESVVVVADAETHSLSIAGDGVFLKIFADNVRAMAETDDGGHLHIDFYPDHPYLGEGSAPLVVNSPHGEMPALTL